MNKKILFLVNHDVVIYNFRKEIVEKYLKEGFDVYISSPYGERINDLITMGCKYVETQIERHGLNPLSEIKLLLHYRKMMKTIKPDVVQSYTIKPNIYGGIAAKTLNIPYLVNVTGFGTAIESNNLKSKFILKLYGISLRNSHTSFFQNSHNLDFALKNNILRNNYSLLPGSGVNLNEFTYKKMPENNKLKILYAGRIMNDKGIRELLSAINALEDSEIEFKIVGFSEDEELHNQVKDTARNNKNVEYLEFTNQLSHLMIETDVVILPSYHEGMSNVLLEAAAIGRPLLASNIPGCREIVIEGYNGLLFNPKDGVSLLNKIVEFKEYDANTREKLGKNSRILVEEKFDREVVVDKYYKTIREIIYG